MSRQQEEHQIKYKYQFIITPLEIKTNNTKIKNNSKTILIKLGNATGKSSQINTPIQLQIEVLYSKTLQKYCPIKGIIKIYDINEDGSEIISCVGAFQTDEILNEGKSKITMQKEIGTSKLKMDIQVINLGEKRNDEKADKINKMANIQQKHPSKERSVVRKDSSDKFNYNLGSTISPKHSTISQTSNDGKRMNNFFHNAYVQNKKEIPYKNTSSSISKSLQKINQALNFKRGQEAGGQKLQKSDKTQLDKQKLKLTDEKLKNTQNEDKIQKLNLKLLNTKSILTYYQNQMKLYMDKFKKILSFLQIKDGKILSQINEKSKVFIVKIKDKQFERQFKEFIDLISSKINQTLPNIDIDIEVTQKQKIVIEIQQYKREMTILKKLAFQKDKKIGSLQKQLEGTQIIINNLKQSNKHLNQQNHYLRQKNDQIQLSVYHKESTIDSLRKQIDKINYQYQQIQGKLYNEQLQIQELKEEIFNCNEIIQNYREKYGDLKNVKNRAIQMQIKQCLRWIDQQNRDLQLSQMEDTMQTEQRDESHDKSHDNLSSVIRNIEIQKAPLQQMSIIRMQLIKILQKVDNLMAK